LCGERSETQRPRVIEVLDERAFDSDRAQANPVLLAAVIARNALKDRVEAVTAVVDRPQRQSIGNGPRGKVELCVHLSLRRV